jgi:hypothetical protein
MPITVKHKFVSAIPDAGDPNIVQPSNWNDTHELTGLGTMAEQNANAVAITGGTISGVTLPASNITGTLGVPNGGTGATTLTGYVKGTGTTPMTASATIPNTDITGLGTASTKDAGAANGVATLDAGGKVPVSELPAAVLGALSYQGTWDASTNTPTLTSSVGTKGYYYVVNVAGNTNLNGITDWLVGDWAVYNGTVWQKVDNTETVTSVNGQTGAVVLTTTDIAEGTNLYYTDVRARASNSAGTGISYDSATGVITNAAPDQTVVLTDGTAIDVTGTYPNFTINNTAPDQIVALTGAGTTTISGTYPNFTITSADSKVGDVVGPASATDNAIARYDTTTGKLIQNSLVIVDDTGSVTGVNALTAQSLTVNNNATLGSSNTDSLDVRARISSDLDPETNNAKDIGTNGRNWRDAFFGRTVHTVNLELTGTTSFDGSQGTSGQVLTSAGTGNTPTWTTPTTGTVTSVAATAGTGISITGSPITTSGTLNITNTAPDQVVSLTGAGTTSISGTYPNFTITSNDSTVGTVTSVSGTGTVSGISLSGTVTSSGNLTLGGTLNLSSPPAIGGTTPAAGNFTTLGATGVATFSAGTVSAPAITTTGDTNTGIFFPAADTIAFTEGGAESMRIDSAGNLGIGTSTPQTNSVTINRTLGQGILSLEAATTPSAADQRLFVLGYGTNTDPNKARIQAHAAAAWTTTTNTPTYLLFATTPSGSATAAERMRIDSAGSVGIGTIPSAWSGSGADVLQNDRLSLAGIAGNSYFSNNWYTDGAANRYIATGPASQIRMADDTVIFNRAASGSAGGSFSWSESIRIDSSGNLAIGTTSAGAKLHSVGATAIQATTTNGNFYMRDVSTTGQELHIRASAGKNAYISFTENAVDDRWLIGTEAGNGSLLFKTGNTSSNTERMRIDASGNLLVGNSASVSTGRVEITKSGQHCLTLNNTSSANQAQEILNFIRNGTQVGNINTNLSTTTYATSSDYRLKENVEPMTNALDVVKKLKPVTYNWKLDGSVGQGFIAHELQAVVPDCVSGEKDAVDAKGKPIYQGIDTSFLVATLTAAIQELKTELDSVKAELQTLKGS